MMLAQTRSGGCLQEPIAEVLHVIFILLKLS
jgi:hypothetical protein